MLSINLSNPRFWVGTGILLTSFLTVAWFLSPGLPVLIGPWAFASTRAMGKELFEHQWQPRDARAGGDGIGPVFNALSCVACHSQGGVGGGGDESHNVRTFEVMPTPSSPTVRSGVVHAAAIDPTLQETDEVVRQLFPIIKGGRTIVNNCSVVRGDFDPVIFGEVNSTALFGAGWIDCIPDHAIRSHRTRRLLSGVAKELVLEFNEITPGRLRELPGGVGRFGWKGQAASLEDFVAGACSNELGLGTPVREQARPLHQPSYPAVAPDLNHRQFNSLVAFVATLSRPVEVISSDPAARQQAAQGKNLFSSIGCALCHVPDMGGVQGVYSDFLLYSLEDAVAGSSDYGAPLPQFPIPVDQPLPSEWKTPALWGVADSAPYFHDGRSPTLQDAILRHRGDARSVTDRYTKLSVEDQHLLLTFLMTLKAPPEAAMAKK